MTHSEIYGLINVRVTSDGSTILHWHLPPDVLDSRIQLAIAASRELAPGQRNTGGLSQNPRCGTIAL